MSGHALKMTPAMLAVLRTVAAASHGEGGTTSHKVATAAHVTHGTAGNHPAKLSRAGLIRPRPATRTGRDHGRLNYYRTAELGARRSAGPEGHGTCRTTPTGTPDRRTEVTAQARASYVKRNRVSYGMSSCA